LGTDFVSGGFGAAARLSRLRAVAPGEILR
jgi:hypothetical protein